MHGNITFQMYNEFRISLNQASIIIAIDTMRKCLEFALSIWPYLSIRKYLDGNWNELKNKHSYIHIKLFGYGGLSAPCIALCSSVFYFGSIEPNKWINQSDNRVKLMSTLATYTIASLRLWRGNQSMQSFTFKSVQSFIKSI